MLRRAYSLLEIKSIDEEKREIVGIATTPATDRMGDIVEPKGAEFKLPIPLLWQHSHTAPVGEVFAAKVTKDGIEVRARFVRIDEPGTLKNRLDEAWQSVKAKLVRGLSIGFQPLERSRIEGSDRFGERFIKWLWLELSCVTIAANAEASITAIKAIDSEYQRAASGRLNAGDRVVRLSQRAGVSAFSTEDETAMNLAEQIKNWKAKRAEIAAAMALIMDKAHADGERSLNAEEQKAFDEKGDDLDSCDKQLERLGRVEKAQVSTAVGLEVRSLQTSTADGSNARGNAGEEREATGVIALPERREKGLGFARFVGCMAAMRGNASEAYGFAKSVFPNDKQLHSALSVFQRMSPDMVVKAAVNAGTTTDANYASALVNYTNLANEFIEWLRPQTILGKLIPFATQVPFNVRVPRQTGGGSAGWVGEGAPKPVTNFAFDYVELRWMKLAAIAVITEELARFSSPSAETIIRKNLGDAIIQQMDSDFLNPANGGTPNVKPASILYGINPIAPSGTAAANVRTDIRAIMGPFLASNLSVSTAVWIMSANTALALSLMVNSLGQPEFEGIGINGGTFNKMPLIVSEAAGLLSAGSPSSPIVALVNAKDILIADDGQVTIDSSREASLQMDSAPDNPPSASTVFRSLWQTNSIGIRAERYVNWVRGREAAVQYLDGVAWAP